MTAVTAGTVTRVQVTREDIAKGVAESCTTCPVALAIDRVLPGWEPDVGRAVAAIYSPHAEYCADLPEIARRFVRRFDAGRPVSPVEFDLTWRQVTE